MEKMINDLIEQIKKETEILLTSSEAEQIYTLVEKTGNIEGDIAEVGVYKGGSARLMCEATNKPIHLFDTFEGLPELGKNDNPGQLLKGKGEYTASIENVKNYLSNYPNVHIYKGIFPSTAEPIQDKKFSFVHFDADLYEATMDCLKFFHPRMNKGGIIVCHNYFTLDGVKKAIDEFFTLFKNDNNDGVVIKLISGCDQCLISKKI